MKRRCLILVGLVLCGALIGGGRAQTPAQPEGDVIEVPAPDPALADHTDIVRQAAAQCVGKTNPVLRFQKGIYRISANTEQPKENGFRMAKIANLTLDGQGATLLMTGRLTPFTFVDCNGVTVRNLTLDWDKPYFAQGKITGGTENTLDVDIDPAFPLPPDSKIEALMDYDPATKLPLANLDILASSAITNKEWSDPNHVKITFRVSGNPKQREHFAKWFPASVGKLIVMRKEVYGHYGMSFTRCKDVVLDKLTIYSAVGMGLHAQECENITSLGVQVRIKPGSGRLMSTTADCQYYTFCKGLIRIEDGYFEGMGDDGFNATAKYRQVVGVAGENAFDTALSALGWRGAMPVKGEKITFQGGVDMATKGTWTVKAATWDDTLKQFHIEVEEPFASKIAKGDLWYSETYLPKVEIRRSTFRGMRSRAILLSTRNVLIEDCKIISPGFSGILLKGGLRHGAEGPAPMDVTVRGCTFEGCGGAAIYGYPDGTKRAAGALSGLVLENNVFREMPDLAAQRFKRDNPLKMHWASAICLLSEKGVTIRGNTFEGYPTGIYLQNVGDVKIEGNHSDIASAVVVDKGSASEVRLADSANMQLADAPEGTIPDIDYINLFK